VKLDGEYCLEPVVAFVVPKIFLVGQIKKCNFLKKLKKKSEKNPQK
jgi:hypothetical protein